MLVAIKLESCLMASCDRPASSWTSYSMIAHPFEVVCLGSDTEKAWLMDMPELERTAFLDGVVKSSVHAGDWFLASVLGHHWCFNDVVSDLA